MVTVSMRLTPARLALMLFAASFTPLAAALVSQYGFGLHPCELCLWQRAPFSVMIGLAALMWVWRKQLKKVIFMTWLVMVAFVVEAAIAFYHVGVEQRWWESATGCSAAVDASASLDDLRNAILQGPLVSCSDPELVVLGLSMAGWNVVYSLLCLFGLVVIKKRGIDAVTG